MKKEKLIATINKEEDSHCRKAAVLQLNILLYNSRLQISSPHSQPLVSAQNENPSECLPSVTAHRAPAGLHLLLCRYSITTQPQLASTGLRFLVIGHQTFAGEGSGSVESVDTVGAGLSHTHILQEFFNYCLYCISTKLKCYCSRLLHAGRLHSLVLVRWICCFVPVF